MFEYSCVANVRGLIFRNLSLLGLVAIISLFSASDLLAATIFDEIKGVTEKVFNPAVSNKKSSPKKVETVAENNIILAQAEVAKRERITGRKKTLYNQYVSDRNQHMVTVIAGEISSADARMAADMSNVLDNDRGAQPLRIVPLLGRGGVQNIMDLLFLKGVDMTIISQGQLGYLELQDPEFFQDIRKNIKYITKLYNSELQILAHRRVRNVRNLQGKKVALGKKLGATDLDARYVFSQLGIDVEVVNVDFAAGVELLENNEVEAVVAFGGAPIDDFNNIREPSRYQLLPIVPQSVGLDAYFKITNEYLPIKLTPEQYPNLIAPNESVSTISSSVVLAVYNWSSDHKRYKKLQNFVNVFFEKLYRFEDHSRHPKWQGISLDAKVPGWAQFGPAQEWLVNRRKEIGQEISAGEMKIAMDAFVRQYSKIGNTQQMSPLQRDDIWASMTRVFGRWWFISEK